MICHIRTVDDTSHRLMVIMPPSLSMMTSSMSMNPPLSEPVSLSGPSNNTAGSYASVAASPGTIKGAAATAALAPIEAHTLLHTPLAENIELTHAYQDQQVKQSKQKTITVSGDDSTIIETYGNGIQDGMCKRFSNTVLQ